MPNRATALILGVTGQDGALLASQLLRDGWRVFGGFRRGTASKLWRLDQLGITESLHLINVNLSEPLQLIEAFRASDPTFIFHLAGESFVADSFLQPRSNLDVNTLGTLNVLEAMRLAAPEARLFFASSSEIFGINPGNGLLDESSPTHPRTPYGVSKLAAQHLVTIYRQSYGLFASTGVLFNHEGPFRARNFVTRKITYNLARLSMDGGPALQLGNMNAERDWGSAAEFAESMVRILELETPDDFIVATGRLTSVRTFLETAAFEAGFDPSFEGEGEHTQCRDRRTGLLIAETSTRYFRPFDTPALAGNSARLVSRSGFSFRNSIEEVAREMVRADIERREKGWTNV